MHELCLPSSGKKGKSIRLQACDEQICKPEKWWVSWPLEPSCTTQHRSKFDHQILKHKALDLEFHSLFICSFKEIFIECVPQHDPDSK